MVHCGIERDGVYIKKYAHCKFKETNALADYIEFKRLRATCIKQSRSCYRTYLEHIEGSMQSNMKYFWSYIKKCKKLYSLPSHVSYTDRLSSNDKEASDMFASFFGSVYRQ